VEPTVAVGDPVRGAVTVLARSAEAAGRAGVAHLTAGTGT
jgi:hypothetical protein